MNEEPPPMPGFRTQPLWLAVVVALVVGQAGLALQLFGGRVGLHDSRPVVAGRHPLHFYHGTLGAETFRQRGASECFDPSFQAGYPKTPVFDGGCRPAELVLYLSGEGAGPGAYKFGLFLMCLAVPLVYVLAARGVGLSAAGACVAGVLGCGVWWSPPVRQLLDAGHLDFLLAGHAVLVYVAWLSRYHWEPGVTAWLILAVASAVGWFGHPVIWLGLAPVLGLYYLAVAPRHGLAWHLGLFGVTFFGLAPNIWWLLDWGKFWWLRQPSVDDIAPLPTWGAVLDSWAGHAKLLGPAPFGWPVVAAGLIGCVWLARLEKHRSGPLLLILTGCWAFFVARLGAVWSPLTNGEADRAAPLVVGLAVLPAAGWVTIWCKRTGLTRVVVLALVGGVVALGWGGHWAAAVRQYLGVRNEPLAVGLTRDQADLVRGLMERTTPEARILFEESPTGEPGWNWTALLPWLTNRAYIGGLDPDAKFEHAFCRLRGDTLNGRRLVDWSDAELEEFCRRYNVGWVVTRSQAARDRWQRTLFAREVRQYRDGGDVRLFELNRPRSFVLTGQATLQQADRRKIVLTDVVPADAPNPDGGPVPTKVVVLSLHHQAGLRASPGVLVVERDPDPYDPIPMVRLRVTGPLSRVVLSWENP
jgi:hypothetical protein